MTGTDRRRSHALRVLENLWHAETPLQQQLFAQHHLGSREGSDAMVVRMRALLHFVVGLTQSDAAGGSQWRHLEQITAQLAAEGLAPAALTLRSIEEAVPTMGAETEPSPPRWPSPSERVERTPAELPSLVRSVALRVASEVDETLLSGSTPTPPNLLVHRLLDAGDSARALEIYAALCAETEVAPPRRPRIHEIFGLTNEADRRALDHRFESLFDAEPNRRAWLARRVALLVEGSTEITTEEKR